MVNVGKYTSPTDPMENRRYRSTNPQTYETLAPGVQDLAL